MRHLALPFYCAAIVSPLLALLARAIYTGATSFLLPFAASVVSFTWCGVRDLVRNWPAFREEMRRRAAERQRAPMPADDTY
ncbi:hypothetical protein [Stenotrophomonas indicatrix]|uniref:hypothetical protein n=1 Tax=Stenotrophomonas indicatrix TaxID=2045451 RepID=UPI0008C617B3|nr:hypothetical protein [Stenotrophomonas indicatrix]SET66950.1 hypothetical protein SAMN05720615_106167 [Stenotrophomonas indicatrix]